MNGARPRRAAVPRAADRPVTVPVALAVPASIALSVALSLSGCSQSVEVVPASPPAPSDPTPQVSSAPVSPSPLAGERFYLDPGGHAASELAAARAEGRTADAQVLERLARPTATWFSGQEGDATAAARSLTESAQTAGRTAVLVLYNIPQRDCGSFSGGGALDGEAYKAWVGQIGSGLGDRPAVVVLEPDAVPQAVSGCPTLPDPAARYQLLSESVDILAKQSGTRIYLDAGHDDFVTDTGVLAQALRASGVERTDGVALNVSNFQTTEATTAYGQRLSDALGGVRSVIDTGRNGAGPAAPDGTGLEWCNPRGRQIGSIPTGDPGIEGVDALLWIKPPGDSDGACRPGEPPAGEFWLDYARELVD